jgi:hypothetical protein
LESAGEVCEAIALPKVLFLTTSLNQLKRKTILA